MLTMLFETGHPWITFKDACNLRSPQQHVGVVHSSNLCTEITLNTSDTEIAVCNLGSVNLPAHLAPGADGAIGLDHAKLKRTIGTAMRMLDNVIDINYYAVDKARNANFRHRPVGLGVMGFQDCLYRLAIPYASAAGRAVRRPQPGSRLLLRLLGLDRSGRRAGALFVLLRFPVGSRHPAAGHAGAAGGRAGRVRRAGRFGQPGLGRVARTGSRVSECATPTAWRSLPPRPSPTSCGVSASIEPTFQNLFVKSNLSGEFTVVNEYLVRELKALGIWDEVMVADLKYFDGSLARIDRVPGEVRELFATAFEIDAKWLVECGGAAPEMDRSGAVAQYIYGWSLRAAARRAVPAGVDPGVEDHVLPQDDGGDSR